MTEEGWKCQAFTKKFSATLWACPMEDHWALMYPYNSYWWYSHNPPLRDASHSLTTGHNRCRVHTNTSHLEHSDTPAPQPGIKWQHHSFDQGMPNPGQDEEEVLMTCPKSPPQKQKPMVKASKEAQQSPFLNTLKWWGWPNGPTVRPTRWSLSKKGCMT